MNWFVDAMKERGARVYTVTDNRCYMDHWLYKGWINFTRAERREGIVILLNDDCVSFENCAVPMKVGYKYYKKSVYKYRRVEFSLAYAVGSHARIKRDGARYLRLLEECLISGGILHDNLEDKHRSSAQIRAENEF